MTVLEEWFLATRIPPVALAMGGCPKYKCIMGGPTPAGQAKSQSFFQVSRILLSGEEMSAWPHAF
jgi:hypothetical protein